MICAARKGHKEVVALLLKKNADPNVKAKYDITALGTAVTHGHKEVVALLLEGGADPNAKCGWGEQALIFAIEKGDKQVVDLLIEKGASPDGGKKFRDSFMLIALKEGHDSIVKALLAKWVECIASERKDFDAIWDIGDINKKFLTVLEQLLSYLKSELKESQMKLLEKIYLENNSLMKKLQEATDFMRKESINFYSEMYFYIIEYIPQSIQLQLLVLLELLDPEDLKVIQAGFGPLLKSFRCTTREK